jgi:HSP20 family protein
MGKERGKGPREERSTGLGGFLNSLSNLLETLGDLAETGGQLQRTGELGDPESKVRGVYGLNIKVGIGDEGVKVAPFGNVHKDEQTGKAVVSEVIEPLLDVFDEDQYVLVVAEMPGVGEEDVDLALRDDILTIAAERGGKKYRKEVLLPASFATRQMAFTCRNGILEVKLNKGNEQDLEE